jgi:hypothetical protein
MHKNTEPPTLLCLDTKLPWTQESFEAVRMAIGISRLSNEEPSSLAIALSVKVVAGQMSTEEAIQKIVVHHAGCDLSPELAPRRQ